MFGTIFFMHVAAPKMAEGCAGPNPMRVAGPEELDDAAAGLDDAARGEQEYLRRRLREELGREPSEEEMDEWLREHTEGY